MILRPIVSPPGLEYGLPDLKIWPTLEQGTISIPPAHIHSYNDTPTVYQSHVYNWSYPQ